MDVRSGGEIKPSYRAIDHVAIAVRDLASAVSFYCDVLGFQLRGRRTIRGEKTGMISAELEHGTIKIVLCQGTEPSSQVSLLVDQFGPGVAHIAFQVDDVAESVASLKNQGLEFDTNIIVGPGLTQAFTSRDPNSGMSFELINRSHNANFSQANIESLFSQLEKSGKF